MRHRIARLSLLTGLATAATTYAQPVFPDIIESEVESSARVTIDTPITPISQSASAFDDDLTSPLAEALAEIERRPFAHPYASCEVVTGGWHPGGTHIRLDTTMQFDLAAWEPGSSPRERTAEGSWRHLLMFEIDQAARVDLGVRPSPFDGIEFFDYEPGRLTGPDGVIVSGSPGPGITQWIWLLTLEPGRYTFESFGSFETSIATASALRDRAALNITFSGFIAACRPDLDGDGDLTIFDFLLFQNLFDAGDDRADFDGDGELTIFDFLTFQNAFDAGCE